MEKDQQLNCIVGKYTLTVLHQDSKLLLRASSELTEKEYQGELTNDTLPSWVKEVYGNCAAAYEFLGEIIAANGVTLSDNAELKFVYQLKMGKM